LFHALLALLPHHTRHAAPRTAPFYTPARTLDGACRRHTSPPHCLLSRFGWTRCAIHLHACLFCTTFSCACRCRFGIRPFTRYRYLTPLYTTYGCRSTAGRLRLQHTLFTTSPELLRVPHLPHLPHCRYTALRAYRLVYRLYRHLSRHYLPRTFYMPALFCLRLHWLKDYVPTVVTYHALSSPLFTGRKEKEMEAFCFSCTLPPRLHHVAAFVRFFASPPHRSASHAPVRCCEKPIAFAPRTRTLLVHHYAHTSCTVPHCRACLSPYIAPFSPPSSTLHGTLFTLLLHTFSACRVVTPHYDPTSGLVLVCCWYCASRLACARAPRPPTAFRCFLPVPPLHVTATPFAPARVEHLLPLWCATPHCAPWLDRIYHLFTLPLLWLLQRARLRLPDLLFILPLPFFVPCDSGHTVFHRR